VRLRRRGQGYRQGPLYSQGIYCSDRSFDIYFYVVTVSSALSSQHLFLLLYCMFYLKLTFMKAETVACVVHCSIPSVHKSAWQIAEAQKSVE
jgi:hypothetical protein